MITMVPGQGGWVSVSVHPLTITPALVHPSAFLAEKQTKVDIHVCFVVIWRDEDIPPLIKILKAKHGVADNFFKW